MATLDRLGPPASASAPAAQTWKPRRAIAAALTVAAAIALLQVVMSSSFTYTGQKLQRLEVQRSELRAQIYEMEADVAALVSLDRTERIAKERLGMVPALPEQRIQVDVEAPSGALLPRPLIGPQASNDTSEQPWWQMLYEALPLP